MHTLIYINRVPLNYYLNKTYSHIYSKYSNRRVISKFLINKDQTVKFETYCRLTEIGILIQCIEIN